MANKGLKRILGNDLLFERLSIKPPTTTKAIGLTTTVNEYTLEGRPFVIVMFQIDSRYVTPSYAKTLKNVFKDREEGMVIINVTGIRQDGIEVRVIPMLKRGIGGGKKVSCYIYKDKGSFDARKDLDLIIKNT